MARWSKALLQASTLLLPFGCSRGYADANLENQAAALLVKHYETVVSARSKVLSQLHFDHPERDFGPKYLGLPFMYLMAGLKTVGPNTLAAVEAGSVTVLTGAKDFVRPAGLGMVSSRTCYIAILTPGAGQTLPSGFSKVKVALIDGRTVWTWSIPPPEGYKTAINFYAAILTSSFLVVANDREDFREVANALAKGTAQADLLVGRADLTALRAHAYWAYRSIRRAEGSDTLASGLSGLPVSAIGLQLFTEYDDGKLFFNVLVPDDRSGSTPGGLPSSESIRFQRARAGVWQAVIDLTTRQTTSAVFQAMSYFGYGVFL